MSAKTYNPKNVLVTFGPVLVSGYGDGVFFNAERNNQASNLVIGSTGDGARALSNDRSGIVTVTLLQTALANGLLSAQMIADENSGNGIWPLLVKDLSGLDVIKAGTAWIQKFANVTYGREIEAREWTFETDALDILIGGVP